MNSRLKLAELKNLFGMVGRDDRGKVRAYLRVMREHFDGFEGEPAAAVLYAAAGLLLTVDSEVPVLDPFGDGESL